MAMTLAGQQDRLPPGRRAAAAGETLAVARARHRQPRVRAAVRQVAGHGVACGTWAPGARRGAVTAGGRAVLRRERPGTDEARIARSEEHTSELQSLMRISYAVFCLKK